MELCRGRVDAEVLAEAERVVAQVDRRLGSVRRLDRGGAGRGDRVGQVEPVQRPVRDRPGHGRGPPADHRGRRWPRTWGEDRRRGPARLAAGPAAARRSAPRRGPADLDGLVLLDLPDHDSTEVGHRLQVDRLVQLVDVLVWVVDPQKYADAALHDRYLSPLAEHADVMLSC